MIIILKKKTTTVPLLFSMDWKSPCGGVTIESRHRTDNVCQVTISSVPENGECIDTFLQALRRNYDDREAPFGLVFDLSRLAFDSRLAPLTMQIGKFFDGMAHNLRSRAARGVIIVTSCPLLQNAISVVMGWYPSPVPVVSCLSLAEVDRHLLPTRSAQGLRNTA